jgi:hypothetical protein
LKIKIKKKGQAVAKSKKKRTKHRKKKHMVGVLHLVLYSKSDVYDQMKLATQALYKQHEQQVATFYYCRDETIDEVQIDDMLMKLPGKEGYLPGILEKTLQAFAFCDQSFDDFEFVVRSNISTVVNWRILLPLLEAHKDDGDLFYGGPFILCSDSLASGVGPYDSFMPLSFAQGTCIVMNAASMKFVLEHQNLLNREIDDDPSIALLLKQHKHILPQSIGCQYAHYHPTSNFDEAVTVRHHHYGSDRTKDVSNVQTTAEVILLRDRLAQGTDVVRVLYHDMDVTQKLILICKVCPVFQLFSGDNVLLDDLFSDPLQGVYKYLTVECSGGLPPFRQPSHLTFSLQRFGPECVLRVS